MVKHVFFVIILLLGVNAQIRRNVAYTFLEMDKNANLILESKEIVPQGEAEDIGNYTWDQFQNIFPILKHLEWDKDKDYELSKAEFQEMIRKDFIEKEATLEGFKGFSQLFPKKDQLYNMCSKGGKLTANNLVVCMGVWSGFEKDLYQHKIPSFYKLKRQADSFLQFNQFEKDIMRSSSDSAPEERKKVEKMFSLVDTNGDRHLDNNEIKVMEPIFLLSMLDRNNNMKIDSVEGKFVFSDDFGGEKVFHFADINKDKELTKNEFVAHFIFALDLDDIKDKQTDTIKNKEESNDEL